MIYSAPVDGHSAVKLQSNMNFNLLSGLRRPTDFSVSSILGNTDNSTGSNMWPTGRLPPNLPSLHSKLPDMLAAEMMQHQLSMRAGIENAAQSATTESTTPGSASSDASDDGQVELERMDLWEKFHDIGTEMVITKCGR